MYATIEELNKAFDRREINAGEYQRQYDILYDDEMYRQFDYQYANWFGYDEHWGCE